MGNIQASPSAYVQDQWLLDHECENCAGCFEKFSFKLRRHHCRACGEVFCTKCCHPKFVTLPRKYNYDTPQRVCQVCQAFFGTSGKLSKLQVPRYVAITRYLKSDTHLAGPPLLPENINRGPHGGQQVDPEAEEVVGLSIPLDGTIGSLAMSVNLCGSQQNAPGLLVGSQQAGSGLLGSGQKKPRTTGGRRGTGVAPKTQQAASVKRYVELCSIKLANWRPLGKTTRIHFCKTSNLVNEVAQSSRVYQRPPDWDMPTPLASSDRSRTTNRSRAETSPNTGNDGQNRARIARHIAEDESYKNAAWTLECGSILHLVLDHSIEHGTDYISCETADEIFYIQNLQPKGGSDSQHITSVRPSRGGRGSSADNSESEDEFGNKREPRSDDYGDEDAFELQDIDHYEHNASGTISLYEELKELTRLMEVRVVQRETMIESGRMNPNRSDAEIITSDQIKEAAFPEGATMTKHSLAEADTMCPFEPILVAPKKHCDGDDAAAGGGGVTGGDNALPLFGTISPRKRGSALGNACGGNENNDEDRHLPGDSSSKTQFSHWGKISKLPLAKLKLAGGGVVGGQSQGGSGEDLEEGDTHDDHDGGDVDLRDDGSDDETH